MTSLPAATPEDPGEGGIESKANRRYPSTKEVLTVLFGGLLAIACILVGGLLLHLHIRRSEHRAQAMTDFKQLRASLGNYKSYTHRYPSQSQGLEALVHRPTDLPREIKWRRVLDTVPLDPWKNPYEYTVTDSGEFHLRSRGPDNVDSPDDLDETDAR